MVNLERLDFIPESATDSRYDHQYGKDKETGFTRGGYVFNRPNGWNKYALNIKGKYVNDVWFGPGERVNEKCSLPGEWAISYHGPKDHKTIEKIIAGGYDVSCSERQQYGEGIYSSPNWETAESFAETFNYNGKRIKAMFMNRLDMSKTKVHYDGRNVYVTENDRMIRPIAVLVKEV
ncbi:uncharacterized protein [Clytia hemisphaerica]|uniref:uncharacterized protein n=1 Tax=Clytia hemisphaerica TaxID=252671 RepID=UPI0034D5B198